jgi:CDP-4-dehydro-6-deoxyglucose reductase
MANAPAADNHIELHIRRWPGGAFSDFPLRKISVGDKLRITRALGMFGLPAGKAPIVMLATSTGIAPFLAILEDFLPTSNDRSIRLFWGIKTRTEFYARDVIEEWQARYPNFHCVPVISELGNERVQDTAFRSITNPAITQVLACGNPAMIKDAYQRYVVRASVPVAGFLSDAFEIAKELTDTLQSEFSVDDVKTARELHLQVNGRVIYAKSGISLMTALVSAGRPIMSVCGGNASCGTCIVSIDPRWSCRIQPPSRIELNLLECLQDVDANTRLACQIQLTPELDGLTIGLP